MSDNLKMSLYNLLSNDKRICRFKEFHDIEVKTIMLFLMQIGYLKNRMTSNFKKMLYLNESICIKKTYMAYIQLQQSQEVEEINADLKTINKEERQYERLKRVLFKYIKKIDSTENNEIVAAFKAVILYEQSMQKLYEDGAKDKDKVLKILKELM